MHNEKQSNMCTLHGGLHFDHSLQCQLCEEESLQPCNSAESGKYSRLTEVKINAILSTNTLKNKNITHSFNTCVCRFSDYKHSYDNKLKKHLKKIISMLGLFQKVYGRIEK